jgi:hypothetical protein
VSIIKLIALLYFIVTNETFSSPLQLCFILFGTKFEVLAVVMFHNVIWVRTTYSLVNGYECFRGAFWAIFTGCQKIGAVCPDRDLNTHPSDYMAPQPGKL